MSSSAIQVLREDMQTHQPSLNAYIFTSDDPHCTQHLSDWEGLGTPSVVVITATRAALWANEAGLVRPFIDVDDGDWCVIKREGFDVESYVDWIAGDPSPIINVGFHPLYISQIMWEKLKIKLDYISKKLIPVDFPNPFVDQSLSTTSSPLFIQPITYSGVKWEDKVVKLRDEMERWGCGLMVVDGLEDVAWMLNLRGRDVPFSLLFQAFVFLLADSMHICVHENKMDDQVIEHLTSSHCHVIMHSYNQAIPIFKHLVTSSQNASHNKIWLSPTSSHIFFSMVPGMRCFRRKSEVSVMKMVKNSVELEGMKRCHVRDGVATCQFLYWLEARVKSGMVVPQKKAAEQLEKFQRKQDLFDSCSFKTICLSGPNSSITHYNPTNNKDYSIDQHHICFIDAGAHYRDGTTDQARTFHLGTPSTLHKQAFTLILKSYIALQTSVFPDGTNACTLDSLAKQPLWKAGLDTHTGLSHAVGSSTCVIQGPFGISSTMRKHDVSMREGMVVSIEPGYYEKGKFGMRFENLVEVVTAETKYNFERTKFLTFRPLTLLPIQRDLIVKEVLTEVEVKWVDEYHKRVSEMVSEEMRKRGLEREMLWLQQQTRPL